MITDTKHRGRPGGRETRILVELMGNALAKEFVLKGGIAMRLAHGSERYTKDIDLDADPAFPKLRWKTSGFYPGSIEPLHLTVEISRRAPFVPSGGGREIMTYAQFQTNVVPTLPQPVAAAIDEKTFGELCLRVGERVERWIQEAQAKLEGEEL